MGYEILNIDQLDIIDFSDYNGYPLGQIKETVRKNVAETEFIISGEGVTALTYSEAADIINGAAWQEEVL